MTKFIPSFLLLCSISTFASATATLVPAHLFNSVNQTQTAPTLHVSFDWTDSTGFNAVVWEANIDFSEGKNITAEGYVGYFTNQTDSINLVVAHCAYHGENVSSDYNYTEAYTKFNYGNTSLNVWHA